MIKHGVVQLQPGGIKTATLLLQEMLAILALSFLFGGPYLLFEHSTNPSAWKIGMLI